MKKLLTASLACLTLSGCAEPQKPGVLAGPTGTPQQLNQRFTVVLQQVFEDDLAYEDKRGVYVITDTKTGQEYVGVSGIGISEVGAHPSGKHTVGDER